MTLSNLSWFCLSMNRHGPKPGRDRANQATCEAIVTLQLPTSLYSSSGVATNCCVSNVAGRLTRNLQVGSLGSSAARDPLAYLRSAQLSSARALVMRARAGIPYTAERWSRANALAYRASSRGWVMVSSAE